jgi:heme o synthase
VETDYANAGVPMLPVVAGEAATRRQIALYTVPMAAAALAPWALALVGAIYGAVAAVSTAMFAVLVWQVATRRTTPGDRMRPEKRLFGYSILYLFVIFGALVADRWMLA